MINGSVGACVANQISFFNSWSLGYANCLVALFISICKSHIKLWYGLLWTVLFYELYFVLQTMITQIKKLHKVLNKPVYWLCCVCTRKSKCDVRILSAKHFQTIFLQMFWINSIWSTKKTNYNLMVFPQNLLLTVKILYMVLCFTVHKKNIYLHENSFIWLHSHLLLLAWFILKTRQRRNALACTCRCDQYFVIWNRLIVLAW